MRRGASSAPLLFASLVGAGLWLGGAACGPDWDRIDPGEGNDGSGGAGNASPGSGAAGATGATGNVGNGASGGCDDLDDGDECTADACQEGIAVHTPEPPGTPCTEGGNVCNGAGECIDCITVQDCYENACQGGGVCTGSGNCNNVGDAPAGTPCAFDGGKVCDGDGECVGCVTNADCTAPATCGGGGTQNQCGCNAMSCQSLGLTCGDADDGCGGFLDCDNDTQDGDETDEDCGGGIDASGGCDDECEVGEGCAVGTDCETTICSDGVCCSAICTSTCKTCNLLGNPGMCANIPQFQEDQNAAVPCTGANSCDGAGNCKKDNGQPCTTDVECASGDCLVVVLVCG